MKKEKIDYVSVEEPEYWIRIGVSKGRVVKCDWVGIPLTRRPIDTVKMLTNHLIEAIQLIKGK